MSRRMSTITITIITTTIIITIIRWTMQTIREALNHTRSKTDGPMELGPFFCGQQLTSGIANDFLISDKRS